MDQVFISYSHDSDSHIDLVLELSNRLRREGMNCEVDQYELLPEEGWPKWMERQIKEARFVLVVCTREYRKRFEGRAPDGKGKGTKWEGAIITRELYESEGRNRKFIPVFFTEPDRKHVPDLLKDATHFAVGSRDGYERLYRLLTDQPRCARPKLGRVSPLPPRDRHGDFRAVRRPAGASEQKTLDGTGHMSPKSLRDRVGRASRTARGSCRQRTRRLGAGNRLEPDDLGTETASSNIVAKTTMLLPCGLEEEARRNQIVEQAAVECLRLRESEGVVVTAEAVLEWTRRGEMMLNPAFNYKMFTAMCTVLRARGCNELITPLNDEFEDAMRERNDPWSGFDRHIEGSF